MTKVFARFARKARISEADLYEAAHRALNGSIDADLGGGVIKQRIARKGQGRASGARAIVLFCLPGRTVFAYGFEKKDRDNIAEDELMAFRDLARMIQGYSETEIERRLADGALIRVVGTEEDRHGR